MNNFNPPNDLIADAKLGNDVSLQTLLLQNYDQLMVHVRSQLSSHDLRRFDDEDVVQQTHSRAFSSIGQLRGGSFGEFKRWLFIISDNVLIDLRRKYNSTKRSGPYQRCSLSPTEDSLNMLMGTLADTGSSPSSIAMSREQTSVLKQALQSLPSEEQELIDLRYFKQKTNAQVAAQMEMSEQTVRRRCASTLNRLRSFLDDSIRH